MVIAAQSDRLWGWLRPRTSHPGAHQSWCRGRKGRYTDRPVSTLLILTSLTGPVSSPAA